MKTSTSSAGQENQADARAGRQRLVLDVEDGLDRVMGDRALYLKLLRRFKHDYAGALRQVQDAVGGDNYPAAKIKVHTLKGAAGMIGAPALHGLAAMLEAGLRAQAPMAALPLQEFGLGLNKVLNTINRILPDSTIRPLEEGARRPADPGALGLLTRLTAYLREGDGAAIDLLENSATVLAASLGVTVYQQVAASAHEFDFDGALAALMQRQWE
ncbi:MAG TPA: Hpt domain-containing protein [Janthinobacterium sp.]|nr:Hpt domain-containing protein [Janthinobacterium sp.]